MSIFTPEELRVLVAGDAVIEEHSETRRERLNRLAVESRVRRIARIGHEAWLKIRREEGIRATIKRQQNAGRKSRQ